MPGVRSLTCDLRRSLSLHNSCCQDVTWSRPPGLGTYAQRGISRPQHMRSRFVPSFHFLSSVGRLGSDEQHLMRHRRERVGRAVRSRSCGALAVIHSPAVHRPPATACGCAGRSPTSGWETMVPVRRCFCRLYHDVLSLKLSCSCQHHWFYQVNIHQPADCDGVF